MPNFCDCFCEICGHCHCLDILRWIIQNLSLLIRRKTKSANSRSLNNDFRSETDIDFIPWLAYIKLSIRQGSKYFQELSFQ